MYSAQGAQCDAKSHSIIEKIGKTIINPNSNDRENLLGFSNQNFGQNEMMVVPPLNNLETQHHEQPELVTFETIFTDKPTLGVILSD